MQNEMTILLLEDDKNMVSAFEGYIGASDDAVLLGVSDSAVGGVALVQRLNPEAVILDLELTEGNGIQFLYALEKLKLPHRPYILVSTRTSAQSTLQNVRDHGAGFIQSKSQEGYGPEMVVDFLRIMRPYFYCDEPHSGKPTYNQSTSVNDDEILLGRISGNLGRIGISAGTLGHIYLADAILSGSKAKTGFIDMENVIYPQLVKKYKVTKASIEKAMRGRIESAWLNTDPDVLERNYTQYVSPSKGRPEVKEFIAYYANKYRI